MDLILLFIPIITIVICVIYLSGASRKSVIMALLFLSTGALILWEPKLVNVFLIWTLIWIGFQLWELKRGLIKKKRHFSTESDDSL